MDDKQRLAKLIADYSPADMRAEFEEMRIINIENISPPMILSLDEFICENEGPEYDSGSNEDEAACRQIDKLVDRAAAYIIGEWAMRDYFGLDYPIDDLRQCLDYGDMESASNARELQYAQIIIALHEFLSAGQDICEILDDKALANIRADIIAGKLDAWIYNSDWDLK